MLIPPPAGQSRSWPLVVSFATVPIVSVAIRVMHSRAAGLVSFAIMAAVQLIGLYLRPDP